MNLIEIANVRKSFPAKSGHVDVLRNVNITIPAGSFTMLFGPSGSGKTTILNTILGLEPPTSGTVRVKGIDIYALSSDERAKYRSHSIGMVHQDNFWVNSLSVVDNVALPLFLSGFPRTKARRLAMDSIKRVHLDQFADSRPTVLSGGEQQRISLARATVKQHDMLVADEPTGNLDTKTGQEIIELIHRHNANEKTTVVMVTHNPDFLPFANNLITIRDGIVEQKNTFEGGM
jgi:putative ABC transport system ATP-binding protein